MYPQVVVRLIRHFLLIPWQIQSTWLLDRNMPSIYTLMIRTFVEHGMVELEVRWGNLGLGWLMQLVPMLLPLNML